MKSYEFASLTSVLCIWRPWQGSNHVCSKTVKQKNRSQGAWAIMRQTRSTLIERAKR